MDLGVSNTKNFMRADLLLDFGGFLKIALTGYSIEKKTFRMGRPMLGI